MSLEQMNQLEREAQREESSACSASNAQALLADVRRGGRSLTEALVDVVRYWHTGADKIARDELYATINHFSHDILRITEMKLAAKAREHRSSADRKRALIKASILPLTEDAQEVSHDEQF